MIRICLTWAHEQNVPPLTSSAILSEIVRRIVSIPQIERNQFYFEREFRKRLVATINNTLMIQVCVHTVRLLHDIVRPPLNLHVGLGNVLPHYAHAEQLDSSDKCDDTHQ